MNVNLSRIKDGVTQLRTNGQYLIDILNQCSFAKHEKTTRMGSTYIIDRDISELPDNIYKLTWYFKDRIDKENVAE